MALQHLKKVGAGLVLAMAALPAMAANILVLTTSEIRSDGIAAVNNAYEGVVAAAAAADVVVDERGALSLATPIDSAKLSDADVIAVVTVYEAMNADRLAQLSALMLGNPDKTFVVFTDGCCSTASNIDPILRIIRAGTGWDVASTYEAVGTHAPLNTSSPYATGFAVNPMIGGHFGSMRNVPGENALYLIPGTVTNPSPSQPTNAYGFFIPQSSMNGGQGACTFLVGDASPFYPNTTRANAITRDFIHAATNTAGACKVTQSAAVDLTPAFSGASSVVTGAPSTLSLGIANLGATGSTDGLVTITLPPGLRVAGALPAGCVLQPGSTPSTDEVIACSLSTIAASGSSTLDLPVAAQTDGTYTATALISGVTGENVTSNNSASFTLTAATPVTPPPASISQVPAMGWPGLAFLAGLVPALVWRRRKTD